MNNAGYPIPTRSKLDQGNIAKTSLKSWLTLYTQVKPNLTKPDLHISFGQHIFQTTIWPDNG